MPRSVVRQACVLVGGKGTRLGALTAATPKPLLPVNGRPFLEWLLEEIARYGVSRITLLAGYLGEQVVARFQGRKVRGAEVEVFVEPEPLGTAGGLRRFADRLDETFLLLNGDTWFDVNLFDLPLHAGESLGALALRPVARGGRYGVVEVEETGRVIGFSERAPGVSGLANGGIYALRQEIVAEIPRGFASLERDVFPRLAGHGALRAHAYDGAFLDIGIPSDYEAAETKIPAIARRRAVFLDRDGVLIEDTGWPHEPKEARWIPGAARSVKALNDRGYFVFVVTNQAGVAHGIYPESQVGVMHRWIADELAREGAHVDAFEYCPHHPDAESPAYRRGCRRRKPSPGMIEDLLAAWSVERAGSFLVGDRETDVAAATAAGIPGYRFVGKNLWELVSHLSAINPGR